MNEVSFDETAVETENSADTRSRTRNQRPLSAGRFSLSSIRYLIQLTFTPLGMRAEAEGKDPHEAVAAANGEDAAEDEGADEGDVPADAEPVSDATAEPVPTEPQGVPNFDDEPQVAIDTEGAVAENHEASAAVFGGAATVPAGPAHEGSLPLVDGAGEDPGATAAMPAMPQE